jgi:hypothetical protein
MHRIVAFRASISRHLELDPFILAVIEICSAPARDLVELDIRSARCPHKNDSGSWRRITWSGAIV